MAAAKNKPLPESPYLAPKEIQHRWRVSRSSVDRLARAAGLTRLVLGVGKKPVIRYLREEVEAYEQKRRVRMTP